MSTERLIEAVGLDAGYANVAVVDGLDLHVDPGEIVALLGPNGAGKTTTLLTLAGVLPAIGGEVRWRGKPVSTPLFRRIREGMGFVTEERAIFRGLSTAENLRLGRGSTDVALEIFPELEPLLGRPAGLLSGGEQQILAVARVLAAEPRLLVVDELSAGLAPLVIERIVTRVEDRAAATGMAVLMVEQHLPQALRIADRCYVLRRGVVALSGTTDDVRARSADLEAAYLSGGDS